MRRTLALILFLGASSCYAANPTIYFDAADAGAPGGIGSDTAASGAGPGDGIHAGTTLSGTNGAWTPVDSTTTIMLTGTPDLSQVVADGSYAIWLATAGIRRWSKILAVDNTAKSVVVQDTFTISIASVSWAIGGKRQTIALSSQVFTSAYEGWSVLFDDSQSVALTIAENASSTTINGPFVIGASTYAIAQGTWPTINCTANAANFTQLVITSGGVGHSVTFRHLKITDSNVTKTATSLFSFATNMNIAYEDCILGDTTRVLRPILVRAAGTLNLGSFKNCDISSGTTALTCATMTSMELIGNRIHHFTSNCVNPTNGTFVMNGNIIDHCTGDGVNVSATGALVSFIGNTVSDNVGDDLDTTVAETATSRACVYNNNFTSSTGMGWNAHANILRAIGFMGFNNYGSGVVLNAGGDASFTTMSTDIHVNPRYINPTSGDYRQAEPSVYGIGFPGSNSAVGLSSTTTSVDIGASQQFTPSKTNQIYNSTIYNSVIQ